MKFQKLVYIEQVEVLHKSNRWTLRKNSIEIKLAGLMIDSAKETNALAPIEADTPQRGGTTK